MLDVVGMVIYHVEDDAYACIVERLYHLLELADAHLWLVRIRRIAALGYIVVHWVVAPVVLVVGKAGLVHRAVIITGQDMDGIHTEFFQVADGPWFRKGQELAWVCCILTGNREITVVHLVDDKVGW